MTVQKIRSRQHNLEDQIEMDYRKMGRMDLSEIYGGGRASGEASGNLPGGLRSGPGRSGSAGSGSPR